MKKSVLLLVISLVFLANSGISQDLRSKFQFGPKIGLNISGVYDTEEENFDADPKMGIAAGLFASVPLGRLLGFQPEVLFSQKGFKASGSILGSSYTFSRTLNYIDVPLLVSLKPSKLFSIVAGPQFSYLISRKDVFENSILTLEEEKEFENDNLRKSTFCFLGGIDFHLNRVVFGTRVGWDLFLNNGDGSSTTPRYKNVWCQATLGLRL